MIYVFDSPADMTEEDYRKALPLLPEERQKKAACYASRADRYACVCAYLLLCYGINAECGLRGSIRLGYGEYGKPFCLDYPQIFMNLSHCRLGAACSVSDRETGIDMQDIRGESIRESLARRVLTETELAEWNENGSPSGLFYRYWAVKESYLKWKGVGLREPMSSFDAETVTRLPDARVAVFGFGGYDIAVFGLGAMKETAVEPSEKAAVIFVPAAALFGNL